MFEKKKFTFPSGNNLIFYTALITTLSNKITQLVECEGNEDIKKYLSENE